MRPGHEVEGTSVWGLLTAHLLQLGTCLRFVSQAGLHPSGYPCPKTVKAGPDVVSGPDNVAGSLRHRRLPCKWGPCGQHELLTASFSHPHTSLLPPPAPPAVGQTRGVWGWRG